MDSTNNSGFWTWDQSKKNTILNTLTNFTFENFVISFGNPIETFTQYAPTYTAASGYSEYFYLQTTVEANGLNPPGIIQPGAGSRYWLRSNAATVAPYFAHLQAQEATIDMTGNINFVSSSDVTGFPENSVAIPSLQITSTVYGAQ